MCGIAGLYTKSATLREHLGTHLANMLEQLSDRGPDSAGVAFYRDPVPAGWCKVSLHSPAPAPDWEAPAIVAGGRCCGLSWSSSGCVRSAPDSRG